MKISTKGRYSLRVMLDLAMHDNGEYIPLKDISKRQEISQKYLEQIISLMNRSGFLKSTRGQSGGYKLAKAAGEYTAGDILRAAEGSLCPVECVEDVAACNRAADCPTLKFWQGLNDTINRYVDGVTLEDLISLETSLFGNDYSI